jgi:CheY-specific phosphatase CheX
MESRYLRIVVAVAVLGISVSRGEAEVLSGESIGTFTAVQGTVSVVHPGSLRVRSVNVHDDVLFRDVIETQRESRTKAFFDDDSILTVGENSRVEITEHVYNPDQNIRRVVVKLFQGRLRALVSKVFTTSGSKFEIHTPTAVAAARGTYFVVWVENGVTGMVNIGKSGKVDFSSGGRTVTVAPGEYTFAEAEQPPASPLVFDRSSQSNSPGFAALQGTGSLQGAEPLLSGTGQVLEGTLGTTTKVIDITIKTLDYLVDRSASMLASAMGAIEGTVLKDAPKPESATDVIRAIHPVPPVGSAAPAVLNTASDLTNALAGQPASSLLPISGGAQSTLAGSVTSPLSSAVSASPLAPVTSTVSATIAPVTSTVTSTLAPVTSTVPISPPAVISGATSTLGLTGK